MPGARLCPSSPTRPEAESHLKKTRKTRIKGEGQTTRLQLLIYLLLFCLLQIRVAGALAAMQAWPGLGLAITREGPQGPLSPQIPTKPETAEVWGWGEDSQEQEVRIARKGWTCPARSILRSGRRFLTSNSK